MNGAAAAKLLTAEVHWSDNASAVLWVGAAPVHQYWPVLAPHFSGSFLPPQRRTEGEAVAWSWRGTDGGAPAGPELAELRARLAADLQKFIRSQAAAQRDEDSPRSKKNRENLSLLLLVVEGWVGDLLAKSDPELAKHVAQTEAGLRLHSWGAKQAAPPLSPEQLGRDISGLVLKSGKAAAGVEVLIESLERDYRAQVSSDESGHFRFLNVARGRYRLNGRHRQMEFPAAGLEVAVEGESIAGIKLRAMITAGEAEPEASAPEPAEETPPRRRRPFFNYVAGAVAAAGLSWLIASGGLRRLAAPAQTESGSLQPPGERPSPAEAAGSSRATSSATIGEASGPAAWSAAGSAGGSAGAAVSTLGSLSASHPSGAGAGSASSPGSQSSPGDLSPSTGADSPAPVPALRSTQSAAGAEPETKPAAKTQSPSSAKAKKAPAKSNATPQKDSAPSATPPLSLAKADAGSRPTQPDLSAGTSARSKPKPEPKKDVAPGSAPVPRGTPTIAAKSDKSAPTQLTPRRTPRPAPPATATPETSPGSPTVEPAPSPGWSRRIRLNPSPWRTRLLIDPILPTAPAGDSSLAALEALRQRLLTEQRAKIPFTFRPANGTQGLAVEGPGAAGPRELHWEGPAATESAARLIDSHQGELGWDNAAPLSRGQYRLLDQAGFVWAQLEAAAGQPLVFVAREGVRASYFFHLMLSPADPGAPVRFRWQRASGGPLPPSWRQMASSAELRLEVPIQSDSAAPHRDRLALFDAESGWGLTAALEQTPGTAH